LQDHSMFIRHEIDDTLYFDRNREGLPYLFVRGIVRDVIQAVNIKFGTIPASFIQTFSIV